MTDHDKSPIRRWLQRSRLAQIVLIGVFWLAGEALRRLFALPVPGGILGLFLVLLLFATSRVDLADLRLGARWLLAEMLLFFIPAVPAVVDYPQLYGWVGLKVLLAIVVGTVIVMLVTGFVVDACFRRQADRDGGSAA